MTRTELLKTAKPILFNTEMVRAILDGRKTVTRRVSLPNADIHEFHSAKYPNGWWIRGRVCKDWDTLLTVLKRDECKCRYRTGDILYVRETWCWCSCWDCGQDTADGCIDPYARREFDHKKGEYGCIGYKASFAENEQPPGFEIWKPSIHMPKEAARIFLRVTDVRVERLQDINSGDYRTPLNINREGLYSPCLNCPHHGGECKDYILNSSCRLLDCFIALWESTIKKSDIDRYGWFANPWVWVIEFEKLEVDNHE